MIWKCWIIYVGRHYTEVGSILRGNFWFIVYMWGSGRRGLQPQRVGDSRILFIREISLTSQWRRFLLAVQSVVRCLPFLFITLAKIPCFPAYYDYCKWTFVCIVIFASLRAGARPWPWWHGCEMNAPLWLISVSFGIKRVVPPNRGHTFIAAVFSRVSFKHSASVTTRPFVKYLEIYALFCMQDLLNVPVTILCAIQLLAFKGLKLPSLTEKY